MHEDSHLRAFWWSRCSRSVARAQMRAATRSRARAASARPQSSSEREVQKLNRPARRSGRRSWTRPHLLQRCRWQRGRELGGVQGRCDRERDRSGQPLATSPCPSTFRPVKPGTMDPFDFMNDSVTQSWIRKGKIAPKGQYTHFSGSFDRVDGSGASTARGSTRSRSTETVSSCPTAASTSDVRARRDQRPKKSATLLAPQMPSSGTN